MRQIEERNKLVEQYMNVVPFVISKEYPSYLRDEDMMQEGYIGLIDAADRWKEDSGCPFTVYAIICVKCAIVKEITRRNTEKRSSMFEVSLQEIRNYSDDETLEDLLAGDLDVDYFYIEEFLRLLSDNEKQILKLLYIGYNKSEIAAKQGISHQRVSQATYNIMRKWNDFYDENRAPKQIRIKQSVSA